MDFIKTMKKRNLIILVVISHIVLALTAVGVYSIMAAPRLDNDSHVENDDLFIIDFSEFRQVSDFYLRYDFFLDIPEEVVIKIGGQAITEQEFEVMNRLHTEFDEADMLMSMHMYIQITNMLLFQYAEELGIAPTMEETRTFINNELVRLIPASDFIEMGITEEEYWIDAGFRNAQNILVMDALMNYLNDNDPVTQFAIEQYQNFVALGRTLMQEWMINNPDIVMEFSLDEASLIFSELENY